VKKEYKKKVGSECKRVVQIKKCTKQIRTAGRDIVKTQRKVEKIATKISNDCRTKAISICGDGPGQKACRQQVRTAIKPVYIKKECTKIAVAKCGGNQSCNTQVKQQYHEIVKSECKKQTVQRQEIKKECVKKSQPVAKPVYHAPAPVYHAPAPVYHAPAPVAKPVYHAPAPVRSSSSMKGWK